jgi:molybdopterin-guanine dinucleotide biosynthesis protein MobB
MFCFSGFSGSGKTALISKLIPELKEFKIGYIKHDAHGFEMDKPGKDTFVIKSAGAEVVMINDQEHEAILSSRSCFNQEKNIFLDSDLVLVEGHKYSKLSKIIIVDEDLAIIKEINEGRVEAPIAFVCSLQNTQFCRNFNLPIFDRNDIVGIANFIREQVAEKNKSVDVYGLVLSGGTSSRMKRDKGEINYHGIPQVEYTYNILKEFCREVFVSCRKEQSTEEHLKNLPQIHDRFLDCGPLGGILSAMSTYRKVAWLVFACDLPMINGDVVRALLEERGINQVGTAFYNLDEKRFEPLAALYEPKSYHRMFYFLAEGKTCPQKVLYNSQIKIINIRNNDSYSKKIVNVNTPEECTTICAEIGASQCELK